MKKFFLIFLFLNSACSINIAKYYQEGFDQTEPSKLQKVIYQRFSYAVDNEVVNRAYFEVEVARQKMDLLERGSATVKTVGFLSGYRTISEEQFKKFAEKSGAKFAVCYVFPGKLSITKMPYQAIMSINDDYLPSQNSTIYKMFFFSPKASTDFSQK